MKKLLFCLLTGLLINNLYSQVSKKKDPEEEEIKKELNEILNGQNQHETVLHGDYMETNSQDSVDCFVALLEAMEIIQQSGQIIVEFNDAYALTVKNYYDLVGILGNLSLEKKDKKALTDILRKNNERTDKATEIYQKGSKSFDDATIKLKKLSIENIKK
ncbi:MAG: hypothetical protein US50_C0001G0001 [Candidatus Nomurabacteria bacterium GW2011_GWB1_37_5]|uniref:Uncharacterized protein n=1 Tax=Candidatus Nomurabacteria bacterium GW2011_GWB1_37_5 TaxID=1618742 RepID=A0A0G0JGW0_9BACT|nr:MAG: hypothetical protein US50_C0001G0001 [Candidatus Nomurabacteria bacterium GW2011_GWB1_37_5]